MQWVTPKLSEDVLLRILIARQKLVDFCSENFQWYYVDFCEDTNKTSIVSVWSHFLLCCIEMITLLFFVYFLKTFGDFDVLGNGPLAVIINTVKNNRKQTGSDPNSKVNIKTRKNRSRSPSRSLDTFDSENNLENVRSALISSWSSDDEDTDDSDIELSDNNEEEECISDGPDAKVCNQNQFDDKPNNTLEENTTYAESKDEEVNQRDNTKEIDTQNSEVHDTLNKDHSTVSSVFNANLQADALDSLEILEPQVIEIEEDVTKARQNLITCDGERICNTEIEEDQFVNNKIVDFLIETETLEDGSVEVETGEIINLVFGDKTNASEVNCSKVQKQLIEEINFNAK